MVRLQLPLIVVHFSHESLITIRWASKLFYYT